MIAFVAIVTQFAIPRQRFRFEKVGTKIYSTRFG